jgi:hypothetical protein
MMAINDKFGKMCKETVMGYFKVSAQAGGTL